MDSTDKTMTLPIHPATNMQTPAIDFDGWRHRIRQDVAWNYHFEMGCALWRTGDWTATSAAFSRAVEADPHRLIAHCGLFLTLGRSGQSQDAAQSRAQGLALMADFDTQAQAMELCFLADHNISTQEWEQAISQLDKAASLAMNEEIRAELVKRYLILSRHFIKIDQSVCLDILDKASNTSPNESSLYFQIGLIYREIPSGMEKAENSYNAALKNDPDNINILINSANANLYLCNFKKSQDQLQRAFSQDPYRVQIIDLMGHLMLVQNRFDEAEQLLMPAIASNPANLDLVSILVLNRIGAGRLADAKIAIDEAMSQGNTPYQPIFINMQALIAQRQGDYATANTLHSKAAAMAPHAMSIHIDWGFTLHLAGQEEEARAVQQGVIDQQYRWFAVATHLRPWATEQMKAVYRARGVVF